MLLQRYKEDDAREDAILESAKAIETCRKNEAAARRPPPPQCAAAPSVAQIPPQPPGDPAWPALDASGATRMCKATETACASYQPTPHSYASHMLR